MRLDPEEPEATGWERLDETALTERLRELLPEGRALVLVDGRGGSGKSTFASYAARLLGGAMVSTDDVAWNHDMFGWDDLLLEHVVAPWRRGEAVSYRPPGWVRHDRPGAVEVPTAPALVIEGCGAGRASLAAHAGLVVWVQSDRDEAKERGLARDVRQGRERAEAEAFWDEWMETEEPFFAADRPWERAGLVVVAAGPDDAGVKVVPGPLSG